MDYGNMLSESFEYAQEGLIGKWMKWLLLLVATILLGIPLLGYELKILRGEKPSPEVSDWGTLIIDGIKFLVIVLIYLIPLIIIGIISIAPLVLAVLGGQPAAILAAIGAALIGFVVFVIVAIIIALFACFGVIRFARTGSMGEAFNFSGILATIGRIGWLPYILALIILFIIIGIVEAIGSAIPFIGQLLLFLITPFIVLFEARYMCQLYDSAGPS
ncbi:MAG: DUF4013 domain-containing protein [Methanoregula sp.]|jgi:hypothetical protein